MSKTHYVVGGNRYWPTMEAAKADAATYLPAIVSIEASKRKTVDVFEVRGDYGQGFEMVTAEMTREAARQRLHEYRENEPGIAFCIVKTRERIQQGVSR